VWAYIPRKRKHLIEKQTYQWHGPFSIVEKEGLNYKLNLRDHYQRLTEIKDLPRREVDTIPRPIRKAVRKAYPH
jgi:hypothetical protein